MRKPGGRRMSSMRGVARALPETSNVNARRREGRMVRKLPDRPVLRPLKRSRWIKLAAAALLIAALAAAWRFTRLSQLITPANVTDTARALRATWWAPLALVLAYTPAEFLMFPRAVLTLFGSVAFGAWLGAGYGLAGIFIASLATYFAGHMLPDGTVR